MGGENERNEEKNNLNNSNYNKGSHPMESMGKVRLLDPQKGGGV